MLRAEVRDKKVYDMVMANCELLLQNSLSLLEVLGWSIDVNLAMVYLPTNFFIERIVKIIANVRQLNIQIF